MTTPASTQTFVSYCRVSTQKQGKSGLGLEAQRDAVQRFVAMQGGRVVAEFQEVESGKRADRPQLALALERCRLTRSTLLVAKLDRLTRDTGFLAKLRDSGVNFMACDNPHATSLTVTILIAVAEEERRLASVRTREALARAKARGVRLGNPMGSKAWGDRSGAGAVEALQAKADGFAKRLASMVLPLKAEGQSLRAIADKLNGEGIVTAHGKAWQANSVRRLLARLDAMAS